MCAQPGSIRRLPRVLGLWLTLLAATNLVVVQTAQADVNGQLGSFFSSLGGSANVTGPVAYNGQQGGYYSGGNLWVRFPAQQTYSLGSLQMPSVKAGCGGIDIFTGSFSFINTDQIVAAMKAAANGALAFVFDLAINAISSQIGSSIEKVMQKLQQFTQHSLNACQAGEQAAAGLAGMVGARDSHFCQTIGNSQGIFSDWAASAQGCGTGGSQTSTLSSNADKTIPSGPYNYTWSMLTQKYPSFDTAFKQYLMSLVGTVIYQPGTSDTQGPTYKFLGQGDPALITALLDGGSSAQVFTCDNTDQCLNPTQSTLTVSSASALKTRVYNLLIDIAGRIQGNQQLTSEEIGLLGATTIPLYKIMVVNAAASFGGMNTADLSELAEITSVDLLETVVQQFYKMVTDGQSSFQNADPMTLKQWQDQLREVTHTLDAQVIHNSERLTRTEQILDRTIRIEGTLRNAMSPQMSAALQFEKVLGQHPLQ
ncbi:conjugal transfer protein TraH [Novosphingobium sp. FSW06-99]|uniref:conjugal transfer protein TraH n=1 Tax=Novosphingobium sp. FSW06-99 TaxID=1739113 RepID=UPI00076DEA19|nr:conjugal transfer protein TraH [Novosphingobium sp. FSW06-99]KUR78054.1 pilus assembly protein [Novosphingobium sp. FSW06-99]